MSTDETTYSEVVTGSRENYRWSVRADTDTIGMLGITQYGDTGEVKDRVLLTPKQVAAVMEFYATRHGDLVPRGG